MMEDSLQKLLNQLDSLSTITETYYLPSKGRLDGIPNNGQVVLRQMTTHEEKMRTGSSGSFWKVMSTIINRCIVEPKGLDSYKLTMPDFIFLMYKLRIVTYGNNLPVMTKCPHCKRKNKDLTMNLDNLKVVEIPSKLKEPIEVSLPKSKLNLECKMLRVFEYDQSESEAEKQLEENPSLAADLVSTLRLCRQVKKINGETFSETELRMILDKLPAADSSVLEESLDKWDFGLDLTVEVECPYCNKKYAIKAMAGPDFFRFTPKK